MFEKEDQKEMAQKGVVNAGVAESTLLGQGHAHPVPVLWVLDQGR